MPWQAWKSNSSSRSRVRIVGYTPLPPWNNLTVLMYRLLHSPWRGPLYVSSLNGSLASMEKLLRHWIRPLPCVLGRPLLWIARNFRIVDWWRPVGVNGLSATGFVNWAKRCSIADSCMHSRAVPLSFEPYVLGAAHH